MTESEITKIIELEFEEQMKKWQLEIDETYNQYEDTKRKLGENHSLTKELQYKWIVSKEFFKLLRKAMEKGEK